MRNPWIGFIVAAMALALSIWAYDRLPASMATHWNLHGEADGFSSRLVGAFVIPVIMLGLRFLAGVLPRIDPRGAKYESFRDTYWLLINGILLFLGAVHVAMIGHALGWGIDMSRLFPVGIGLLFILIGNYLGRVEPNWFMGIRSPWTLSSDVVWRKVHRTGAWLFVTGGVLMIAVAFLPRAAVAPIFVATIVLVAGVPVVQSYVLWRRLSAGTMGPPESTRP